MDQASRLSLVSKVLFDRELIELRKENEKLKLTIFWHKHGVDSLRNLMAKANKLHPQCLCVYCTFCGRTRQYDDGVECTFKPWFENKLRECGLKTHQGYPNNVVQLDHECSGNTRYVLDMNVHFIDMATGFWTWFTYGASLWKASSINDPELKKLELLFQELSTR
jgi:hypothetical protein